MKTRIVSHNSIICDRTIYRSQDTAEQADGDDYTIEHILSEDWWDDGAWDMQLPPDAKKTMKKSAFVKRLPK